MERLVEKIGVAQKLSKDEWKVEHLKTKLDALKTKIKSGERQKFTLAA